MVTFNHKSVFVGVLLSLCELCSGELLGLSFGLFEDSIMEYFKADADAHASTHGSPEMAKKAVDAGWKNLKRAPEHFMGLGSVSLAMCLFIALSPAPRKVQLISSTAVGFGALCYPAFWALTAYRSPSMGAHAAKESLALMAQAGACSGFLGLVPVTCLAIWWAFRKTSPDSTSRS